MRRLPFIAGFAALVGCYQQAEDQSVPSVSQIARVEAALAKHRCIGDLRRWERNYRFSRKSGLFSSHSINPDIDVIELHLRRAGTSTILPERKVMRWSANGDWPDSRTVKTLDGRYSVSSGVLSMANCIGAGD